MPDIILHHYDTSPFSEKVRLLFGLKGMAWRSVIQPTIMPKPDLTPLTGGYRRIPVLQIGADVYCDSQVILAEVAARGGGAPLEGAGWAVNLWSDRLFFGATVPIIFGEIEVPEAFIKDREALSGRPFDSAQMKAAAGPMKQQWRAQAAWLDQALDGRDLIAGDQPGLADVAAYMNVWFLGGALRNTAEALMSGFSRLAAWRQRVRGIGHGQRSEMTTSEALAAAKAAEPEPYARHDASDPTGFAPGAAVQVMADDYGRDPILGTLVALNADRVVLAREDPALGRIQVHFPRVGYIVLPG
ncbi:MAG TPA: glutathione S-transferase family protein [Caulobacteraceae bacterium]|jgi:glutathione S-transferase|nr:glutathione S-transferase family protein [Caulobacteraceae bacterium]